jgi:hypothetical protein
VSLLEFSKNKQNESFLRTVFILTEALHKLNHGLGAIIELPFNPNTRREADTMKGLEKEI